MIQKTILVTGGAGYIGSHTSFLLSKMGYKVLILDKLVYNQTFEHPWATLIVDDFGNEETLNNIFKTYNIDAVMHFAASIEVGKSVTHPKEFYENNVTKTTCLINTLLKFNIKKFIFSSSCAVYGNPVYTPMDENHPKNPISPYGRCKLMVENILEDYSNAYDLKFISLRYFNAAGASPELNLGERHIPETHLIPLAIRAMKQKKKFYIYGNDYNTKDGTCMRDFIHVKDIAKAHVLALEYLEQKNESNFFNLGTGKSYSIKEVINIIEDLSKGKINTELKERRKGDVDTLEANPSKAFNELNWKPEHSSPTEIIKSAIEWENIIEKTI